MIKKILLYSHDPGGANTLIPLINPLKREKYLVALYGSGPALRKYQDFGFEGKDISTLIGRQRLTNFINFLDQEKPDLVITGTSDQDKSESLFWQAAAKIKIPSFAILDQWANYQSRFSYLPTKILVMDVQAKNEAIKSGIKRKNLLVTGQPYFEYIKKALMEKYQLQALRLRKKAKRKKNDYLIVFASEPISITRKSNYLGYDEQTILVYLIKALREIGKQFQMHFILIIKPHPREKSNYQPIINKYQNQWLDLIIDKDNHHWSLILAADLVCGMTSMFLVEALLLGKKLLSIQIGRKIKDDFVLLKRGIIKSIYSRALLKKHLIKVFFKKNINHYNFQVINDPVERIIKLIKGFNEISY